MLKRAVNYRFFYSRQHLKTMRLEAVSVRYQRWQKSRSWVGREPRESSPTPVPTQNRPKGAQNTQEAFPGPHTHLRRDHFYFGSSDSGFLWLVINYTTAASALPQLSRWSSGQTNTHWHNTALNIHCISPVRVLRCTSSMQQFPAWTARYLVSSQTQQQNQGRPLSCLFDFLIEREMLNKFH